MAIDWTKIFKQYRGKWIALRDDEKTVIASGKSVKEVMAKASKRGFPLPILFLVPTKSVAYIGLLTDEIQI